MKNSTSYLGIIVITILVFGVYFTLNPSNAEQNNTTGQVTIGTVKTISQSKAVSTKTTSDILHTLKGVGSPLGCIFH